MSVSSIPTQSGSGRKSLDADLNLVPFIDLLVCCICFLLITAVWTQMARIDVNQTSKGAGRSSAITETPKRNVKVLVDEGGYTVVAGAQRVEIPRRGRHDDTQRLRHTLRDARAAGAAPTLTVASVDGVSIARIITTMDIARGANFAKLRLIDAAR